ncbi:MAG: hypothetical protein ACKE5M_00565 [Methylophilaceae bacterium]
MYQQFLSVLAITLTLLAFVPYIISINKGKTKPHVFSWIIWGSTTFIAFLAQVEGGGGIGVLAIGLSGIISIYIAFVAWVKKSEIIISRWDWLFFLSGMLSLPLWYLTNNPLWAIVILTAVDAIGFMPTIRKVYSHPFDEDLTFFGIFMVRNFVVVSALSVCSLTTILFPAVMGFACLVLILVALYRRNI